MPIVEACWNHDMLKRPTFSTIVNELKKVGASKYSEGLSTPRSTEFWEEAESGRVLNSLDNNQTTKVLVQPPRKK